MREVNSLNENDCIGPKTEPIWKFESFFLCHAQTHTHVDTPFHKLVTFLKLPQIV